MHLLYIVGNRPQFIKLAVLHKHVKQHTFIRESIIHTGQHFSADMSDIFFKELAIELPIINLSIHSLSHVAMIGRTMEALEPEIKKLAPDFIVVFGDTNATLAGALTGKKLGIPIIHIEAGIRTFDEVMPEESNRYLTDRMADVNFCCTYLGVQHLEHEGYNKKNSHSKVINSGDLMLDAFYLFKSLYENKTHGFQLIVNKKNFVLATVHRKQNIESIEKLSNIIHAFNKINETIPVVCPMHPNTKQVIEKHQLECSFDILPPQGYLNMQKLLTNAIYVITDSGGLQREAFFAQKPTLILMEKPFWPELIQHGNALSSSSDKEDILNCFNRLQTLSDSYNVSIFGDGNAATIITNGIIDFFNTMEKSPLT